jgi:hypothetical protein
LEKYLQTGAGMRELRLRSAAFLLPLLAGHACGSPVGPDFVSGTRVSVFVSDTTATLLDSTYRGLTSPTRLVVLDPTTWRSVWEQLHVSVAPVPPLPSIDFAADRVLVVALGWRPTGGFDIRVDSVVTYGGGSVVFVTMTEPLGCTVTQSSTWPTHVIRVSRLLEPVVFRERATVHRCR